MAAVDFAHAAQHVPAVAQALWGQNSAESVAWTQQWVESLQAKGPRPLLAELRRLQKLYPDDEPRGANLAYFRKRRAHLPSAPSMLLSILSGSLTYSPTNSLTRLPYQCQHPPNPLATIPGVIRPSVEPDSSNRQIPDAHPLSASESVTRWGHSQVSHQN